MKSPSSFAPFFCFSFILHLLLFFLISLNLDFNFFLLNKKKPLRIRQAIRVDSIGLPELIPPSSTPQGPSQQVEKSKKSPTAPPPQALKTKKKRKKPLKKKTKAPPPKKTVKKAPPPKKKKPEDRKRQAIEKLKALRQIEKMQQEAQEQQASYKGQQISKGNARRGEVVKNFEMVQYFTSLKARINMYWSLPQELARQSLRAKIYVRISDQGAVLNRFIMEASGNEEFDARVLESVDRAGPFPPPPESVKNHLTQGVVFIFPE